MTWLQKGRSLATKPWIPWLVFTMTVAAVLAVTIALYRLEDTQHRSHFTLAVHNQIAVLESGIHTNFRPVQHLATLFSLEQGLLDQHSFLLFAQSMPLAQSTALVALQWYPRMRNGSGQATFPFRYSYSPKPYPSSEAESGWNRIPDRFVERAGEQQELLLTPWYMSNGQVRFRVLRPVFRAGTGESQLIGFVSGLFRVDRMITEALCAPLGMDAFQVFVTDPRSNLTDTFYCFGENARSMVPETAALPTGRWLTRSVSVNGERWTATAVAMPGAFVASRWIPFVIGFGGLVLGGIFALLHHLLLGREAQISQLVQRRTEQLEAMNRELEQFAYVASHDLKAPLRAVSQLSSWIVEDAAEQLNEENRVRLRLMRERVIRMDRLIEGLLAYSRATRITGEVRESVPLPGLLEELGGELALPAGFRIELQYPLPSLQADPLHLKQIFQNLIINATAHHDHPESGTVTISAEGEKKFWRVEVADDGPGIPAAERERVFGMFTSLGRDADQQHIGIGLAIVRKLVLSYGGQIDVVDNPPHGARFRIWWPKPTNHAWRSRQI